MRHDGKVRIYKTYIRPILTYTTETRTDTSTTKRIIRTAKKRILRKITGHTLRDRVRNTTIRDECDVPDIVKRIRRRKREWNSHVIRMEEDRMAKIARDGNPPHG